MAISNQDIKKLYALSAGKCNLCKISLFPNRQNIHIGEMAHIIAKSSQGPRGIGEQQNNNSYENLILLCPTCHTKVDKAPSIYTKEYLYKTKQNHENNIQNRINNPIKDRQEDIKALNMLMKFWNFTDLVRIITTLPEYVNLDILNIYNVFDKFQIAFPQHVPFYDSELQRNFINFWNSYLDTINMLNEQVPNPEIQDTTLLVFIQNDLNYNMYLNHGLPHEIYTRYLNKIKINKNILLKNYYNFLNLLRKNYNEVVLSQ